MTIDENSKTIYKNIYSNIHDVLHDLNDFQLMEVKRTYLLVYIFIIFIYLCINISMIVLNLPDQDFIEGHYYLSFHLAEFWAVFIFVFLEMIILHKIGYVSLNLANRSLPQKFLVIGQYFIMFVDIVIAFLAVFIFTVYPEYYEVPSHYIEYIAQIFISFSNILFTINFIFGPPSRNADIFRILNKYKYLELCISAVSFILSIFNILIYSCAIPNAEPEHSGHYFEFSIEIVNVSYILLIIYFVYQDLEEKIDRHYVLMHKHKDI